MLEGEAELMERGSGATEAVGSGRGSGTAVYQGLSPQTHRPVTNWSARLYQAVS